MKKLIGANNKVANILPEFCNICHYPFWVKDYDFVSFKPKYPATCPCCHRIGWKDPNSSEELEIEMASLPYNEKVRCYCPYCKKEVTLRRSWVEKQKKMDAKKKKKHLLPYPIEDRHSA